MGPRTQLDVILGPGTRAADNLGADLLITRLDDRVCEKGSSRDRAIISGDSGISTFTGVLEAGRHKGRAVHQYFLTSWEGADPDIPVLKQTKAEHAKLQ